MPEMDLVFEAQWRGLLKRLEDQFGMPMDLDGILFLIGIQELGQGVREFSKNEKIDLMHIAVSALLAPYGYYREERRDQDGWPHFQRLKPLPEMSVKEQEQFMREAVVRYFGEHLPEVSSPRR